MSQNVYDKLGDIKEATDKIRELVAADLGKSEVLCSTIEELPGHVENAISNNRQYYGVWIFTTDSSVSVPDIEGLRMDPGTGRITNLPDD